ncbi:MAG TPA: hypothetical protein VJ696_00370 [Rhodanobacteraceae bacterium]|nr:hypothetical protein [Rhodanobacteraceae bacterium]
MDARAGKWLIAASLCIGSLVPARALACWPLARDIPYDDKRPLITLHGSITDRRERQFSTKALNDVLATLLVSDRNGRPYPFVLYVHGRGNEPSKSFSNTACGFVRGHVLEKIEKDDVRVLGINWDSKARTDCERPIDRAEAAAPLLEEVVRRLLQHRRENPKLWSGTPGDPAGAQHGELRAAQSDGERGRSEERARDVRRESAHGLGCAGCEPRSVGACGIVGPDRRRDEFP